MNSTHAYFTAQSLSAKNQQIQKLLTFVVCYK